MLSVKHTGSIADMIADMRGVSARLVPYAASTALTRVAQRAAKQDLPNAMRSVFDRPTNYTLNSLFVKAATIDSLSARVMVKNSTAGLAPERPLEPEVFGGVRSEKRFERALRFAGLMKAGERALPSSSAALDAHGNVSGAVIRSMLASLGKPGSKYFAGAVGKKKTRGVWVRESRSRRSGKQQTSTVKPLFIFTTHQPTYRQRLDFSGIVQGAAQDNFKPEFDRAFADLLARRR